MNKLSVFLLATISALVSFGLSGLKVAAVENYPAIIISIATPKPKVSPKVERIELDKNEITVPCPPSMTKYRPKMSDSPCYEDEKTYGLISVKTTVYNPKNNPLTYYYKTSGGQIVGEGEKVVWNLQGVRPGTYTIFVQIGSQTMFYDESITQTITIRDSCCCIPDCFCPTLDVTGGGVIKAGETMTFEANVSGGDIVDTTYNWTISKGEIVEGQGTPKITVKTSSGMSGEIKATVEIGGNGLCAACPRTDSETGSVIK